MTTAGNKQTYFNCYNADLNRLFDITVDKLTFYEQAKRGTLAYQNLEDVDKYNAAILTYYERQRDNKVLPVPTFVTFERNTLYMSSRTITVQQGKALREYLMHTRNMEDKRIHKLIIDSCNIGDETLSTILDAISKQTQVNAFNGTIIRQYL